MNITPVSYNYSNMNSYSVCKQNSQVSFYGGKTAIIEKAKDHAGCLGLGLLSIVLSPLALFSLLLINKDEKIDSLTASMQRGYTNEYGSLQHFNDNVNDMNKLLDKHAVNDEYAQFVKESMSFLRTNFERNQNNYDENMLLAVFSDTDDMQYSEFIKFMNTMRIAAKAAVSKNGKDINKEELDNRIQSAREIMHGAK